MMIAKDKRGRNIGMILVILMKYDYRCLAADVVVEECGGFFILADQAANFSQILSTKCPRKLTWEPNDSVIWLHVLNPLVKRRQ